MNKTRLLKLIVGFTTVISLITYFLIPTRIDNTTPITVLTDSNDNKAYQAQLAENFDKEINQKFSKLLSQIETSRHTDMLLLESEMKAHGANSTEVRSIYDRNSKFEQGYCKLVTEMLDKYGWPGINKIGSQNSYTLFTTIQNADFDVQDKYMGMMEEAVKTGSLSGEQFANLVDRKALAQHHSQIYGTQVMKNNETGLYVLSPVANEQELNSRRGSIGLVPLPQLTIDNRISHAVSQDRWM